MEENGLIGDKTIVVRFRGTRSVNQQRRKQRFLNEYQNTTSKLFMTRTFT